MPIKSQNRRDREAALGTFRRQDSDAQSRSAHCSKSLSEARAKLRRGSNRDAPIWATTRHTNTSAQRCERLDIPSVPQILEDILRPMRLLESFAVTPAIIASRASGMD